MNGLGRIGGTALNHILFALSQPLKVRPRRFSLPSAHGPVDGSDPIEQDGSLTSWIALVTLMPLGYASVQLKIVRQRNTPVFGQDAEPFAWGTVTGVQDEPVRVHDGRRTDLGLVGPEDRD